MGLRLKIIINPSSGRERARLNIEDTLAYLVSNKALERADISYTSGPLDATKYAMSFRQEEYDAVIAVGGDGTVNEVITGMMRAGITLPLAIYTSGTVNDFATSLGLPNAPYDFARMLMNPKYIKVDCGRVNDRYFLNVLAGGLMSDVAYKVPSELKTNLGPAAYWISAMKDIPTLGNTIPITLKTADVRYDTDAIMFFISNSKSVGGFKKLMIEAQLNDGLLDVLVLSKVDYAEVVPLLGKLVMGEHINDDKVIYFQTDYLEISTTAKNPVVLDVDGEEGPSLPATIECMRNALNLIVPNEEEML